MNKNSSARTKKANKIDKVEVTSDILTSRGGLILFVRYLNAIGILSRMESLFGALRKSRKGKPISEIFKQLFCFFLDGTSRHLVYFDSLAKDEGYARGIETEPSDMLSSHAVKRFFHSATLPLSWLFRRIMLELFIWRLRIAKPDVIELGLDSMVMDNDEAQKREGAKSTYKKVKGFQPLQMTWGRFIIDAIFRSGDRHSNHGNDSVRMIKRVVNQIYSCYRTDVAVVVRMDSGFFDQKVFEFCEKEHIGYICGGKMYNDIKTVIEKNDRSKWFRYKNAVQVWEFTEFADQRNSWNRSRRVFYSRPLCQDRQMVFAFERPSTLIYTNIGTDDVLDDKLRKSQGSYLLESQGIIKAYHDRGADELVHRALKDFGFEELPFLRFHQNAAFYYTMLIGFMLFESFKVDVCVPVIHVSAYATTVRRKLIDIAAKIARHSGEVAIKISRAVFDTLKFDVLWEKSTMQLAAV